MLLGKLKFKSQCDSITYLLEWLKEKWREWRTSEILMLQSEIVNSANFTGNIPILRTGNSSCSQQQSEKSS